ncbi:hypothetical protein GCM10012275_51740 [Longimycelium tulufanense]|uniref:Transglycosylase SLT domain-containing protein n=1 Tax=Longimycelium tulufanense TaxID=907463 RepID=A0A8J3FW78_9PSEU|nr:lytic murein transglycosylase [Longimycelium tulufanense]GGM74715.1 hypothetical protein GCM10012275_51740 [Longimycelium tulufanense]
MSKIEAPTLPPLLGGGPPRPRRRALRLLGRLLVAVLLLGSVAGGAWLVAVVSRHQPNPDEELARIDPAPVEPGTAVPEGGGTPPEPGTPAGATRDPLDEWAERVASRTDAPARALRAYANADLIMRAHAPACHISWTTLAGVGRIESNHGRWAGRTLGDDGRPSKPIIGIPLDGSPGVAAIRDTDGGRLDGDTEWDRAVGPMQFIPDTWARWASDGNGDGAADPHNIDDAALTAARYLCAGSRDMATGQGWWAGLRSYNDSVEYAQKVFGVADKYARASLA